MVVTGGGVSVEVGVFDNEVDDVEGGDAEGGEVELGERGFIDEVEDVGDNNGDEEDEVEDGTDNGFQQKPSHPIRVPLFPPHFHQRRLPFHTLIAPTPTPQPAKEPETNILNLGEALKGASESILKPGPHIMEFCHGTENPTLCADTIAPFFHGSFDPVKALETEIKATLNQTMKVASIIADALASPDTDKNALDVLDVCRSQYESIVDTVKESLELLAQQNVVDAYYKFNSVISDQSACEDAFVESPGVQNPFAGDSLTVFQLGGNCLAIMDSLVNSPHLF
ncbi:hypothetical protein Fmac_006774 [Flemingia macrophylla]|uniref:Pectinesterase inhibitor domain-containing protein n=1 Tax=Flemingia macrophylla TaxID=520843 RepID=A0ABD1NBJ3_9FABA